MGAYGYLYAYAYKCVLDRRMIFFLLFIFLVLFHSILQSLNSYSLVLQKTSNYILFCCLCSLLLHSFPHLWPLLQSIVSELSSHGIYVILDMHQDVISSRYGHYDGVPRWLIDSLPPPKHAFPWPFEHRPSPWAMGYLTEAVGNAFQQVEWLGEMNFRICFC